MPPVKDISGRIFGRLTVIGYSGIEKHKATWECRCECGNIIRAVGISLRIGRKLSCGCLQKEAVRKATTTHNGSSERLYNIWRHMIWRCENPNADSYSYYGGKGISVCEDWRNDYEAFRDWANSNGYDENQSIDRIDSDKNYSPENCQWITMEENIKKRHKQNKPSDLPIGVCKKNYGGKDRYLAYSYIDKKRKYEGSFDTIEEATNAIKVYVA